MKRRALITGVAGQDGSYLAEFLLGKEYEVHGMVRRSSTANFERIEHLFPRLAIHRADLLDQSSLESMLREVRPHEIYNLAAQSNVPAGFQQPLLTGETTALGVTRLLEAVRIVDSAIRFFQASSSEMFGEANEEPQNERTPFRPRNPYGISKAYGHWMTVNYRENHGIFACSGMMYNHESPRRGKEFATRKTTDAVARIKLGLQTELTLGNLDAMRDWGFAGDYVRAAWLMLQQETPGDYVIATGEKHSIREMLEIAFGHAGLNWRDHVRSDPALIRPKETNTLRGDAGKARKILGWEPTVSFPDLICMMVDADLDRVRKEMGNCEPGIENGEERLAPALHAGTST
jgi:GDPmannose 4,6-dehydratase